MKYNSLKPAAIFREQKFFLQKELEKTISKLYEIYFRPRAFIGDQLFQKEMRTIKGTIENHLATISKTLHPIIGKEHILDKYDFKDYKFVKKKLSNKIKRLEIRTGLFFYDDTEVPGILLRIDEWLHISDQKKRAYYEPRAYSKRITDASYYQIKESISKITEGAVSILETFLVKEPVLKFLAMDQELPTELEKIEAKKRLEIIKKLEKTLEEEVEKTDFNDAKQAFWAKELYDFAQNCGIQSETARKIYKFKRLHSTQWDNKK